MIECCIVRPMGKNTKRMTRTTDRPARRASRSTAEVAPPAPAAQTPVEAAAPVVEIAAAVAEPASAPVRAPTHAQVAQLAFRYFAETGYVHGHALDHWLRAEAELARA